MKSYADITIGQYQEIGLIDVEDPMDRLIQVLAIIKDRDPMEIEALPLCELMEMYDEYKFIGESEPGGEFIPTFTLEGPSGKQSFGFIDLSRLSTGEFIVIDELYGDGFLKNLHKLCAVFFRKISIEGPDYKVVDFDTDAMKLNAKLMQEVMPVSIAMGAVFFLSSLGETYLKDLTDSLQRELTKSQTRKDSTA